MSLPGTRSPLGNSTNDLHARTPSPAFATAKTTQSKQIRRKVSVRAFHPHVDSSESFPSEHSSIFEALWTNPSVESFDTRANTSAPGDPPASPEKSTTSNDFLQPQRTTSPTTHPRTIHIPTQLTTITEQKSLATLRPQPSLLSHLSKPTAPPRRKTSFSLDDLSLFRPAHSKTQPHHLLNPSSDDETTPIPPPPTYPNTPHHPPPHRTPTPPGLPTFNTPQAIHYRLPAPRLRFQDWFSTTPCEAEERYMQQTAGLPRGVVMRGEGGVLVRGRWRPVGGGYAAAGGLEGHRFCGGGVEVADVVDVAGEGMAAGIGRGRGVEEVVMRVEGVGGERGERRSVEQGVRQSEGEEGKQSRWVGFWEGVCFVCCGVEKGEDGLGCPRVVSGGLGRGGPGAGGAGLGLAP